VTPVTPPPARQVLLIDLEMEDLDVVVALLRDPTVRIRRVAGRVGSVGGDAGLRAARLWGLPTCADVVDLTREIYDVAVIGSRSPRGAQLEQLMRTLETAVVGTDDVRRDGGLFVPSPTEAPTEDESAPASDAWEEWSMGRVPIAEDVGAGWDGGPVAPAPERVRAVDDDLVERLALHRRATGAHALELHVLEGESLQRACLLGEPDALIAGLVPLARISDEAWTVAPEAGDGAGRLWGAWPLCGGPRRGVLAVAGARADFGDAVWRDQAAAIERAWNRGDASRS
jgi:hypothetical protein